jgi:hypothetical protein
MSRALFPFISWQMFQAAVKVSSNRGTVRLDPRTLEMALLHELKAEGTWLFPKLRLVEVYLAFFRVWLRRELQHGKYAHLRLSADEWDEKVESEEILL